uniref:Uncharacterized protein n=1 Tax=Arundo donax TaxID=35708 RepID=A0A0A8YYC0_ARUDO
MQPIVLKAREAASGCGLFAGRRGTPCVRVMHGSTRGAEQLDGAGAVPGLRPPPVGS